MHTTRTLLARLAAAVLTLGLVAAPITLRAQDPQQAPPPPPPASVAGKWAMSMDIENMGPAETALDLKQEGEKVTGTYTGSYGAFQVEGTVKGRILEFAFAMSAQGTEVWLSFRGEVAADGESIIKGTGAIEGLGSVSWTAKRKKS
ncbi:MAG: hypothetical protein R2752_00575 [Vicinamibacterales bacterium]